MKIDIKKIEEIVGENNYSDNIADLYVYSSDASVHQAMPAVIVKPKTIEEVQKIVCYANKKKIPVTPRGAGSGTSGHTVPIDGGIVLDLKQMNRILEIRPEDMLVRVEPGVVDDDLNRALNQYGLFYPPAPASSRIATIGGEIAANASGVRSVKYGATRDYVLGMKVVLADGSLVNLGSNTRVHSAGYQLERLIVGSEGTLGIVVEATMRITPLPKFRCLAVANFNSLKDAGNTISDIITSGSQPSMLELMDKVGIIAVNKAMNLGLPEVGAIILFEADGNVKEAVDYEMKKMKGICEKHGGSGIEMSYDAAERKRLFSGRKKLFAALSRYKEGIICTDLADDMGVPNSKIAQTAEKIHEIAERNNVIMAVYGHCGSGVIHTKIMFDTTKKSQWKDAERVIEELYDYVHSVGGVTSAEHGIGLSKAPAWKKARSDILPMMKAIKKALDPNNILNPHKLMDAPDDWVKATNLRYNVRS
ncbi:MAG: FAD-binding oxidoreductase [Candidatus Thermoplasmatota archaeon]|nr:FAD-binding oxidoreductase [Candidatus Thermoplasmatota archaeon]MBU1940806.1 FAD-binding oxidoreductase [Candidatus Thermoplasmatota archaeon]